MANDFTGNPWVVDATFSTGFPVNINARITHIAWMEMAAGATVVIQDGAGRPIVDDTSINANENRQWDVHDTWFRGIKVPTLSSGKLYFYLAP